MCHPQLRDDTKRLKGELVKTHIDNIFNTVLYVNIQWHINYFQNTFETSNAHQTIKIKKKPNKLHNYIADIVYVI